MLSPKAQCSLADAKRYFREHLSAGEHYNQKNLGIFLLLFGPYELPRVPRNLRLRCEMRGLLRVCS